MDKPSITIEPPSVGVTKKVKLCEHKFVHYDTKTTREYSIHTGITLWTRIDYFFCEKCLEIKEKRKSETSRNKPEWF